MQRTIGCLRRRRAPSTGRNYRGSSIGAPAWQELLGCDLEHDDHRTRGGGMLAGRYALMYPADIAQLVLVDPIGLEDWKAKGVPSISVDDWYARELKSNADSIRQYEKETYFGGQWKPEYEPWVQMYAGLDGGSGKPLVAWNSALLYDMIYTQPVVSELENIAVPTLLMIGNRDNTAIGKDLASPAVRATLGHYPDLAKQAARRILQAQLIEFPDLAMRRRSRIRTHFMRRY